MPAKTILYPTKRSGYFVAADYETFNKYAHPIIARQVVRISAIIEENELTPDSIDAVEDKQSQLLDARDSVQNQNNDVVLDEDSPLERFMREMFYKKLAPIRQRDSDELLWADDLSIVEINDGYALYFEYRDAEDNLYFRRFIGAN